ncbi:hypothetical protein [Mycobacteroides chelonae]|uniref:hypothetical protein n=1 Tax=Mycobacteroides chelonae TaxID=1774 RepID=UPI0012FFD0E6|nr:hypothetical protein [Mycobacteroides chelonae]
MVDSQVLPGDKQYEWTTRVTDKREAHRVTRDNAEGGRWILWGSAPDPGGHNDRVLLTFYRLKS